MIFKRLIVGPLSTNCYIFGSDKTKEVVIIDAGGNSDKIIEVIENLNVQPKALLLTHGHFDHTLKIGKVLRYFEIPLMYNKNWGFKSACFRNSWSFPWIFMLLYKRC